MNEVEELISVKIEYNKGYLKLHATAIIADAALVYAQTIYEPEEYGPAFCETRLTIPDYDDDLVLSEDEILRLIEETGSGWVPIERDT